VTSRTLSVGGERLPRWVDGFAERHGGLEVTVTAQGLLLQAADGATADLVVPIEPWPQGAPAATVGCADLVAQLSAQVLREHRVAVLLVRRGGYACAVVAGGQVLASKVGNRYVQSKTAAGGWSQQRFARRRENQAGALAGSAADVACRILLTAPAQDVLVTGGDRALVEQVLADPRLAPLKLLRRGPHLAVGDPRADTVRAVPGLLRSARILLNQDD
jgi:hypothetical protein